MGITGLLGMLKDACIDVSLSDLRGTVAVIDTYCWLHKALFPVSMEVYQKKTVHAHITFCMKRVKELKQNGIKPIFVFDGRDLEAKLETEKSREENRAKARAELDKHIRNRNMSEARKIAPRCVDITPDLARQLIEKLIEEKIDFVVAPYEADAQIAYLVRNNFAHFAISEDSDLILYGCEYVLYKLNAEGNGTLFQLASLPKCLTEFKKNGFCFDTFKRMCIMSGCDYLPNIPKVGLQKAKKFFASGQPSDMRKALPKLPSVLNMKTLVVPQTYINKFIEAENTFRYQLVFCPKTKQVRPVTDYNENIDRDELRFAGEYLDELIGLNFAIGNVDFETLQIIDHKWLAQVQEAFFEDKNSIWNSDYTLKDKCILDAIWTKLTRSSTIRPDFLDNIVGSAAKKPRLERIAPQPIVLSEDSNDQVEEVTVLETSTIVKNESFSQTTMQASTVSSQSNTCGKKTKLVVRSRFFKSTKSFEDDAKNDELEDVDIFENRKQFKRKIELLYSQRSSQSSSQASTDSGIDTKFSQ